MEAAASVVASRGVALPMPSSRKEWRAVSDHHSARHVTDEELERSSLGQSDERTIYEHGSEPADVDFCSINVDGSLDNDILQQRIHSITRQREELQQMEIEFKAQAVARSEIMEMQNSFDAQMKEHENAAAKLKEQLREREQALHELERRMEEKDRELHAIKLDTEAAWAKEDLLREQNKELATFRRERDHSEAERAQHIQQIRELQDHVQEKERQVLELQEQHRADQETMFMKDEQLKVWIARVQEMDALLSTNHSLQVELRERTEQYNHLWMIYQRQLADTERLHISMQQLHLDYADVRERSSSYPDEGHISQKSSKDISKFGQNNGSQLDVNGSGATSANNGALPNGNTDNASNQSNQVAGVPIAPSSLIGMPTYLPPGQMTVHPFLLHQQGIPHSMPSHISQSHVGHFHSIPAMSAVSEWQNQQDAEGAHLSAQNQLTPSQTDHDLMRSNAKYEYEVPVDGQGFHPDYLDIHINEGAGPAHVISSSSTGEPQALDSMDRRYMVAPQADQSLQQISSQFSDSLRLNPLEQSSETKEQNTLNLSDQEIDGQVLMEEQPSSSASASVSETSVHSVNLGEAKTNNGASSVVLSETLISSGQTYMGTAGKTLEAALLDERSLLACIVRTIPPRGSIRINSTLPNRLGKMLAPLHWHDYKKKYGKLDEFVASHPELFYIEGENILLREGAQEMIAATTAVAKVAAAAAASPPYSSFLPSVAVTPMAQSHRLKKVPSMDSKHPNGVTFGTTGGGIPNVKVLSKSKDPREMNGPDFDKSAIISVQSKGSLIQGRSNSSYAGKQLGRTTGAALASGR